MPVGFWNDPGGERYRASYFADYPGVWRHGDWIMFLPDGGCVIYGRSDATLNRGGVRMGTSEFYRVVEGCPRSPTAWWIDTGQLGSEGRLVLYVVLAPGAGSTTRWRPDPGRAAVGAVAPARRRTRSTRCPASRGRCPARSWRCRCGRSCWARRWRQAADPDSLANPEVLAYFVAPRSEERRRVAAAMAGRRSFGEEGGRLTYGSYLRLPELLAQQVPQADPPAHDELLFITVHQVYELWFKQLLHELTAARDAMRAGETWRARHLLQRAHVIERLLVSQVDVLETMTPQDFLQFRAALAPASGFQSVQFRELEFLSGPRTRGSWPGSGH